MLRAQIRHLLPHGGRWHLEEQQFQLRGVQTNKIRRNRVGARPQQHITARAGGNSEAPHAGRFGRAHPATRIFHHQQFTRQKA